MSWPRCLGGHSARHIQYLLSCEEREALIASAEGRCARCGEEAEKLVIEHDHAVGRWAVRALTCHTCNMIISSVERGDRDLDEASRRYLIRRPFYLDLAPRTFRDDRRPSRDNFIYRAPLSELVDENRAADMLGLSVDGVRALVETGQLIRGRGMFRRVVVERIAVLLALRADVERHRKAA